MTSATMFGWGKEEPRYVNCYRCDQPREAPLTWFLPLDFSIASLMNQLRKELFPAHCLSCTVSIYRCCGGEIEQKMESDLGSDFGCSDDEGMVWNDEIEEAVELYHCPESQFYILCHLLLLLEKICENDAELIKLRTAFYKRKHVNSGIGYAKELASIRFDADGKNTIALNNTEVSILQLFQALKEYLPDTERLSNTADLVPHPSLVSLLQCSALGILAKQKYRDALILEMDNVAVELLSICEMIANHDHLIKFLQAPIQDEPVLLKIAHGQELENSNTDGQASILDLLQVLNGQGRFLEEVNPALEMVRRIIALYTHPDNDGIRMTNSSQLRDFETTLKRLKYDVEFSDPPLDAANQYCQELKRLSFRQAEMMINGQFIHVIPVAIQESITRNRAIQKDLAILSTSMPIYYGSSALVVVAEERMDLLSLCITGPEGTPYANGLYFFDIAFPCIVL
jgi:hypothetical protein